MIVHNNTKGIHAYGVNKENLVLKVGKNDVDDALWAKAKERHEGLRSMMHDKLIVETKTETKSEAKPTKASKGVDVDVKTGK